MHVVFYPHGWRIAYSWAYFSSLRMGNNTAHDTTLGDENVSRHVTSIVATVLCNQPKAFSSDLGDDQSRYLLVESALILIVTLLCLSMSSIFETV